MVEKQLLGSRLLAYWLRCMSPISESQVQLVVLAPDSRFLLPQLLEGRGDSSGDWVPAAHVGDLD